MLLWDTHSHQNQNRIIGELDFVFQMIRSENRHCSTSQMMIFDRFSLHCLVIVFSAALNCLDYQELLNSGSFCVTFVFIIPSITYDPIPTPHDPKTYPPLHWKW